MLSKMYLIFLNFWHKMYLDNTEMYSTYREGKSIADGSTFLLMLLLLQNHLLLYYFKAFPLMGTLEGLL